MSNQLVKMKIDEQEIQLGYNFNSLVDAEDITNCNLLAAMEGLGGHLTAGQLRGLLYAMIVPYDGFPTKPREALDAAGLLIRMDTLPTIRVSLVAAMAAAVSDEFAESFRKTMMDEPNAQVKDPESQQDAGEGAAPAQ